jgi:hypothetical protein
MLISPEAHSQRKQRMNRERMALAIAGPLAVWAFGWVLFQGGTVSVGDSSYRFGGYVSSYRSGLCAFSHTLGGAHGEELWVARAGSFTYSVMRRRQDRTLELLLQR